MTSTPEWAWVVLAAMESLGIDSSRRAETVTVAEFVALARILG